MATFLFELFYFIISRVIIAKEFIEKSLYYMLMNLYRYYRKIITTLDTMIDPLTH